MEEFFTNYLKSWRDGELLNPNRISDVSEVHIVDQKIVQEVVEDNKKLIKEEEVNMAKRQNTRKYHQN